MIGCGGAGSAEDVIGVVERHDADAVACGSLFHYGISPIPALKRAMADSGCEVRL